MVCVTVVHFVNQVASGLEHQTLKCPPPVCLIFALLLFLLHCAQTKNWNAPTAHKLRMRMYHHLSEVHSTLYVCVASHTLNSKSYECLHTYLVHVSCSVLQLFIVCCAYSYYCMVTDECYSPCCQHGRQGEGHRHEDNDLCDEECVWHGRRYQPWTCSWRGDTVQRGVEEDGDGTICPNEWEVAGWDGVCTFIHTYVHIVCVCMLYICVYWLYMWPVHVTYYTCWFVFVYVLHRVLVYSCVQLALVL